MGSKGGGTQKVESKTTTSNLPQYARPYFERMMDRAEGLSLTPYEAYGGQRIADITPDQLAAYDLTRQTAAGGIPGLEAAMGVTGQNMQFGQQMAAGMQPYQFGPASFQATGVSPYAGFQATGVSPYAGFQASQFDEFGGFQAADPTGGTFDFGPARQFSGEEVQQYMSPYMQNVVDIQKQKALEDYETARAGRSARAVEAGAFGGSRAAVQEGLAEEDMLDRMARIQAEGLERSYADAASQFQADRAAQFQQQQAQAGELARTQELGIGEQARVQQLIADDRFRVQSANAEEFARIQQQQAAELARVQGISVDEAARIQAAEAAELARVQGISVDEAARIQAANAAERARVESSQADENARIRDQQLAALGFSSEQAQQLANLGEMARAGDIQAAQLLETIGQQIEARQQRGLDLAYQDFLAQRDFPKEQLNYMNMIMRGVPVTPDTTQTLSVPYNPMQQLLGAGLGAVGLYRGLTA